MEIGKFGLVERLGRIARAAGRMTLDGFKAVGQGFGAANDGEAGLRLGGAIAMGNISAEQIAEQMFTPPDYVPKAWVKEQHHKS